MDDRCKKKHRTTDWALIVEMIEASMALSLKKGSHPLTPGCNCIACINQRKRILAGNPGNWRYHI